MIREGLTGPEKPATKAIDLIDNQSKDRENSKPELNHALQDISDELKPTNIG